MLDVWPKISVVMPSYNQDQYIEEAILSVVSQDYPNLEFIIMDGASTDKTTSILEKYDEQIFYWESKTDRGQSHALNKAIAMASGEIIFWLNSDDLVRAGAFYHAAKVFNENPNTKIVIGQGDIIDSRGKKIGELHSDFTTWEDWATRTNGIKQISAFFHFSLFEELGNINESLHYCMDAELLLRFTQKYEPIIVNESWAAYRDHEKTKTTNHNNWVDVWAEADQTWMKYLTQKEVKQKYLKWSANNWILLAKEKAIERKKRWLSLARSIKRRPAGLLSRYFWPAFFDLVQ